MVHLREVEKKHRVRILYACEAGSRAYGLNHDRSDYDVRFLFVREETAYLSVRTYRSKRDVITPKVGGEGDNSVWDLSGWDLRKALLLLRENNPTLLEWLFSPVVYLEADDTVESMRKVARQYFNNVGCMHHYFNWMRPTFRKLLVVKEEEEEVNLKKLICVLRLLFALRWLDKPDAGVVPLDFAHLTSVVLGDEDIDILENVNILADSRRVYGLPAVPESEGVNVIFQFISEEVERFGKRDFVGKQAGKAPYETVDEIFRCALEVE